MTEQAPALRSHRLERGHMVSSEEITRQQDGLPLHAQAWLVGRRHIARCR